MNPYTNKEHEALRLKVREFAGNEVKHVATDLDEKEEFSRDLTQRMGDLGLFESICQKNMAEKAKIIYLY